MTPELLSAAVRACVAAAVAEGELPGPVPERVGVERPRPGGRGDWSTSVALALARPSGRPSREVAQLLADRLGAVPGIESADVAGPGFVNLVLESGSTAELVRTVVERGAGVDPGPVVPLERSGLRPLRERVVGEAASRLALVAGLASGAPGVAPVGPVTVVSGEDSMVDGETRDLVDLVGADTLRYSLLRHPPGAPLRLDLALLRRPVEANPAFRVRFAHARLCALAAQARDHGVDSVDGSGLDPARLDHPAEGALLAAVARTDGLVAEAAARAEPHRVARHLEMLASAFDLWYHQCRVTPRGADPVTDAHRARLWLADATRTTLAQGLAVLGVGAPERM